MRRKETAAPPEAGLALLKRAHHAFVAGLDAQGVLVQRPLHVVLCDGLACFHSAPRGEKTSLVGRPALISAVEVIADIPSHFRHPEKACPATTFFESVQIEGTVQAVTDPDRKAKVLMALMRRYQPEGGHVPIEAEHPLYRSAVRGLLIAGVPLDRITTRSKLGQHLKSEQITPILAGLWRRGRPDDLRAIERIRAARSEWTPLAGLEAAGGFIPEGYSAGVHLDDAERQTVAHWLASTYWHAGVHADDREAALDGTEVQVGLRQGQTLVAYARALTDGARHGWIYDVIVRPDQRGQGLGLALMHLLLDHPRMRAVRRLHLGTRDAMGLYARLGFESTGPADGRGIVQMVREAPAQVAS